MKSPANNFTKSNVTNSCRRRSEDVPVNTPQPQEMTSRITILSNIVLPPMTPKTSNTGPNTTRSQDQVTNHNYFSMGAEPSTSSTGATKESTHNATIPPDHNMSSTVFTDMNVGCDILEAAYKAIMEEMDSEQNDCVPNTSKVSNQQQPISELYYSDIQDVFQEKPAKSVVNQEIVIVDDDDDNGVQTPKKATTNNICIVDEDSDFQTPHPLKTTIKNRRRMPTNNPARDTYKITKKWKVDKKKTTDDSVLKLLLKQSTTPKPGGLRKSSRKQNCLESDNQELTPSQQNTISPILKSIRNISGISEN